MRLAEDAEAQHGGNSELDWIRRLDTEHANIRAALDWLAQRRPVYGLRLAGALAWFWLARGYLTGGRGWFDRLLTRRGQRRSG